MFSLIFFMTNFFKKPESLVISQAVIYAAKDTKKPDIDLEAIKTKRITAQKFVQMYAEPVPKKRRNKKTPS
jgi:hypothetical protein